MTRVLLDSDILSEILAGQDVNVKAHMDAYSAIYKQLEFTSASTFEISYGLHRKRAMIQLQRAESLFARNHEVCPTPEDYRLAAEICGALDRQGTPHRLHRSSDRRMRDSSGIWRCHREHEALRIHPNGGVCVSSR